MVDFYVGLLIDGEFIIKDFYLFLCDFDSNEFCFFWFLDFVVGMMDVEGSFFYRKIVDSWKMSLVLEYENNLNFFLDLEILFYVFKNFIVFGVINLLYGNNLILIYKVVVFYYSYRGSLD